MVTDTEWAVAAFVAKLRDLYGLLLSPPLRQLARADTAERLSSSTINDLLKGKAVPRWDTVRRFVLTSEAYVRQHRLRLRLGLPDDLFDLVRWRADYDAMRGGLKPGTGSVPGRRDWIGPVPTGAAYFQRRDSVDLAALLMAGTTSILSGLGGVGKTQLAAEAVRSARAGQQVDLVLWVDAGSRPGILSGYAQGARLADVAAPPDDAPPDYAAEQFLAWLASTDRHWLVVLDDLADPGDLNGLWPPAQDAIDGRVVVTTRRRDAALEGSGRHRLDIGAFTQEEAEAYLAARLGTVDGIAALATDLGMLPLALAQASAYLLDNDLTIGTYRQRFADRGRALSELVPESSTLPDDQRLTLAATWSLSIDRADALRPRGLARPLLEVACLLDASHGLPEEVLLSPPALIYTAQMRDPDRGSIVSRDQARDALRCLSRLSLVDITGTDSDRRMYLHPLVQRAALDLLPPDRAAAGRRSAADALLAAWPETERHAPYAQRLRDIAANLADGDPIDLWQPSIHPVLYRLGASLGWSGQQTQALDYFTHLREVATARFGADDQHTLTVRSRLAYWRGQSGAHATAIAETRELVDIYRRTAGEEHPDTLDLRLYLARWQGQAGEPVTARNALGDLIPLLTAVLGEGHEATLTARNDHAHFQGAIGSPATAVEEFAALLADRRNLLGDEHPHTLVNRNDLHFWQASDGRHAEALAGMEALVPDLSRILGPDHPYALAARGTLARLRGETGDPSAAVEELSALVLDMQRAIGPDHPITLKTHLYLVEWQQRTGTAAAGD